MRYRRLSTCWVWGLLAVTGSHEALAHPLPPPPDTAEAPNGTVLWLELVINQRPTGHVVTVAQRDGHFYLNASELRAALVPVTEQGEVAVDLLEQVTTRYDTAQQRLCLDVPPNWLPAQFLDSDDTPVRIPPRVSPGMLVSYDVYVHDSPHQTHASLWHEWRLFGAHGTLSSTGLYRQPLSGSDVSASLPTGYVRYDTHWRWDDDEQMTRYEVGDLITRALDWNTPVRMGGLQASRNFALRPDIVTYPLPAFSGNAAVPTTVDLFIDGAHRRHHAADPGPFFLQDTPFINGAGEATLVTTDALGRSVSTTLPFYVANTLLRPGLSDYAIALGALRRRYGEDNFDYGEGAFTASYRYGLTDTVTVQAHTEGATSLALGGVGASIKLDTLGVVQGAFSRSRFHSAHGQQYSLSYQYSRPAFSLAAQYLERTSAYADLSQLDNPLTTLSRRSTQLTANLPVGRFGSLGSGYFDVEAFDGSRSRLVNLSWSQPFIAQSTLYLSANRALSSQRWSTLAQVTLPIGNGGGSIGISAEEDATGHQRERVDYARPVPTAGGVGWTLSQQRQAKGTPEHQATVTWRTTPLQLSVGTAGSRDHHRYWAEASGALVWLDDAVFASNQINDAFVLISTDGQPGIPVRYEHQLVGTTDGEGHLLVPNAAAYAPGHYSIDTLTLPEDIEAPKTEKQAAIRAGSGYILRFPVRRVRAASATLVDAQGQVLPVGTSVHSNRGETAFVGWDGAVYFNDLAAQNRLDAQRPDGHHCRVAFQLDDAPGQVAQLGALTCHEGDIP